MLIWVRQASTMSLVHQAAKEDCTVTELGRTGGDSIYYEMLRGLMADAAIQVSPLPRVRTSDAFGLHDLKLLYLLVRGPRRTCSMPREATYRRRLYAALSRY